MADLKTTAEERATWRQHAEACPAPRCVPCKSDLRILDDVDTLLAENAKLRAVAESERDAISARLRAAEAEAERLRGLVRWFLDGDDHTHEDDCGARGQHDLDVCRNTKPCADETCEGPHCTCDATEMRDRARAALGEP